MKQQHLRASDTFVLVGLSRPQQTAVDVSNLTSDRLSLRRRYYSCTYKPFHFFGLVQLPLFSGSGASSARPGRVIHRDTTQPLTFSMGNLMGLLWRDGHAGYNYNLPPPFEMEGVWCRL